MRVMTVRQPWALHIVQSGKDVENRVRNIAGTYRGPVAIHAGLAADEEALRQLPMHAPNGVPRVFDKGVVIGVVDITGVHSSGDCLDRNLHRLAALYRDDREAFNATRDDGLGGLIGKVQMCSPWALPEYHHIELTNPRKLARPIPLRGALGLRELDPAVVAQIERVGFITHQTFGEIA